MRFAQKLDWSGKVYLLRQTEFRLCVMCSFYVVRGWLCKNILLIFCLRDGPVTLISFLHLVSCSDMTNSVGMLDLMHAAEVTPTAATYTALLQSFAEAGDKKKSAQYTEGSLS